MLSGITINRFGASCKPHSLHRLAHRVQPLASQRCRTMHPCPARHFPALLAALACTAASWPSSAGCAQSALPTTSPAERAEARDIFKQLIEINTTDTPKGSVTAATKAMQKRFLDAGFSPDDVHLLGPDPTSRIWLSASAPLRRPRKSPSSSSATSMSSKRCPPTGTPIHFNSSRRMAISTAAARRT